MSDLAQILGERDLPLIGRTLGLREAVNINDFGPGMGGPGTLEALLRAAHPDGSELAQRTVALGALIVQALHFRNDDNCHLVHLVGYVPDDRVQVVPVGDFDDQADLELAPAPDNTEFLDGEMMILVRGNDVIMCRCGMPEGVMLNYIEAIGVRAGFAPEMTRCSLGKRVDIDKLALIAKEGVHRLTMSAVAHSVSVDEAQRGTVRKKFTGKILDEIRAMLNLEEAVPEEAENIKVEVSLSFDKRGDTELAERQLQEVAEAVLDEDEEGFSIETLGGRKIRAKDVLLSKGISMESFGKSVRYQEAWGHLIDFDSELRAPQDG